MPDRTPDDAAPITRTLRRLEAGEADAADDLLSLVYDELHELAAARMAAMPRGETLQATALLHEAWLRLGGRDAVRWNDRAHFFGAAAMAMRRILVENYRRRQSSKRGGGVSHRPLDTGLASPAAAEDLTIDLEALDIAMSKLEQEHERQAEVVMLRFFGGRSMEETAELLGLSTRTVERDWQFARSWLRRELA